MYTDILHFKSFQCVNKRRSFCVMNIYKQLTFGPEKENRFFSKNQTITALKVKLAVE